MTMAGSVALMNLLDATLVAYVHHNAQVFDSAGGIAAWCQLNRIPRATFYRHLERIRREGAWTPRSRRPHHSPGATPGPVVADIVRWRQTLGTDNGAVSIHYHLGQNPSLNGLSIPCPATIHHILRRAGLVTPAPKKRPRSSWRRFSYARPRDCYQIDATVVALTHGTATVFEVLDDCTRTLVATHAAPAETAADAVTALRSAIRDFGVPGIVLSDNGSAFTSRLTGGGSSRFTRAVTSTGARLIHASPYHPQTCGKVERHHRTFKAWLATQPTPATLPKLQALCDQYQHWYNTSRYHSAVRMPPLHAWQGAAALGGPEHLPVQRDATVGTRTVSHAGLIRCGGNTTVSVGQPRAGTQVTIVRDGNHLTVYDSDGTPLGHLLLDPDKKHQGRLTPAA
jgi:transposase InsO family protein